jgi:ribose 1,5-bisphosphokinase
MTSDRPLGPGRLVLVVGPSGAGKDALIALARSALAGDPMVAFPRRVVTRPPSHHEPHDHLSEPDFLRAKAAGAFALAWEAHGLHYGVPAEIDAEITSGCTVVCNVSRNIVAAARERYVVRLVLVTAPADLLAARLKARDRGSDGSVEARLDRSAHVVRPEPDLVIQNVGTPEAGARQLIAAIRS